MNSAYARLQEADKALADAQQEKIDAIAAQVAAQAAVDAAADKVNRAAERRGVAEQDALAAVRGEKPVVELTEAVNEVIEKMKTPAVVEKTVKAPKVKVTKATE